MAALPDADQAWVIRTDFSSDESWTETCREIMATHRVMMNLDVTARVHLIDDAKFDGMAPAKVVGRLPQSYDFDYCFIYDSTSNRDSGNPILVLNLDDDDDEILSETLEFRTYPKHVFWIDSNLSICNMEFDDFTRDREANAVFDGFEEPPDN